MTIPPKTRAARRAAPSAARAGANVFAELARKTKYVDPNLADHWPTIAGKEIATIARPGRLTGHAAGGKTLEVYVRSGAAASQMQMASDELLARANRYFGPGTVARIAIRQRTAPARGDQSERGSPGDSALGSALSSFRAAVKRRNDGK